MRYTVRTCTPRIGFVPYLRAALPKHTEFFIDTRRKGGMRNFLDTLKAIGEDAAIMLEDDIVITRDFAAKAEAVIAEHADDPIQFFSMRKKDLTVGSRYEPGRTFMMNQCHYMPAGMAPPLRDYYTTWSRRRENPQGYDTMMADFFKDNGISYYLHVPSLVDHRVGKSIIDPRRASTNRQSLTFEDPFTMGEA